MTLRPVQFAAAFLLLALGAAQGRSASLPSTGGVSTHIVGGLDTSITHYPYQVSVRLDTYVLLHICGGSIYSPRVIVTAAHCIKGRFASYIRIVAGFSSLADESEGYQASKLIYHSGYNKNTHENDVGLIILAKELVYSEAVQPIPLATEYPPAGTHVTVTGWGKRTEEAETLTNQLQQVDVEIVDSNQCQSQYMVKNYAVTEQMVCAGADGKDSCQGDSGGPLAYNGQLVGIVSWGIGCAQSDYPGVYASVPFHRSWIEESAAPYM